MVGMVAGGGQRPDARVPGPSRHYEQDA